MAESNPKDPQLISYMTLRRLVGLIGILLPVVLGVGTFISDTDKTLQPSISDYYFTTMGDVFVGALFAVAFFLFCYKGHDDYKGHKHVDSRAANIAATFAVTVALFPTSVLSCRDRHRGLLNHTHLTGIVHYTAAALLFLTLAFFCLFLFRQQSGNPTKMKTKRNRLYLICGIVIVACVACIPIFALVPSMAQFANGKATYILETLGLWAFGWSWLVKGEAILGD
jgi:hypothetical protein